MDENSLNMCWEEIPIGQSNAVTYEDLMILWSLNERKIRKILHQLSLMDNGDNYVLIRSSKGRGFYKTDNQDEIFAYKRECLAKGRSVFAPVKKINRILNQDTAQMSFTNNLRVYRAERNLTQADVCRKLIDPNIDKSMLSKFENGVCLPTPSQLSQFAKIYGCTPEELLKVEYTY